MLADAQKEKRDSEVKAVCVDGERPGVVLDLVKSVVDI